jgi:DNA gyrase inhibitor GyrI
MMSFYPVTKYGPTTGEIKAGIYAMNKHTGHLEKIPTGWASYNVTESRYSMYTWANGFPIFSAYDEKYNDLVEAKEILKADLNGYYSPETVGKAIGLIKRFLETHAKTR